MPQPTSRPPRQNDSSPELGIHPIEIAESREGEIRDSLERLSDGERQSLRLVLDSVRLQMRRTAEMVHPGSDPKTAIIETADTIVEYFTRIAKIDE